jgi:N-acetylmuramoyl-L-alanine amidase
MVAVVISSGHGLFVRGASGIIDEVDEARRVVNEVAICLTALGEDVVTFHDNESHSQNENLNCIVDFHNSQERDLDISVHFNAFEQVSKPMGTEVFFYTDESLATKMSAAIASVGFINRGAKKSDDLFFLNHTDMPALLIEVCFVDSEADCAIYQDKFQVICEKIADVLADLVDKEPEAVLSGKVSWFGGPQDTGVSPDEGLAFIYKVEDAPHLFLPVQPPDTTGLARRLDPEVSYIACRWDYDEYPKQELLGMRALVRAKKTGRALLAYPADWGPHQDTGRVADISPGLMQALGITTDDEVDVIFPYSG